MKPMNNLDKAKFGEREFNMKHMLILQRLAFAWTGATRNW